MKRGRPRHDDILTPREWDVAELLREGLTNEEIAARLQISFAAAKYHVGEILSKLGVSSRQQAVDLLDRRQRAWIRLPLGIEPLSQLLDKALSRYRLAIAGTSLALVAVVAGLALFGFGSMETGNQGPVAYEVGLDVASPERQALMAARRDSPFKQSLLFTKVEPANVGDEAEVIASLPRVTSVAELEAVMTPDVNLIVIDQSALEDLRGSDALLSEVKNGRSLMGLNVTLADLHRFSDPARDPTAVVWETSPEGITTYKTAGDLPGLDELYPAPPAGVTFFSFLTAGTESEIRAIAERPNIQPHYRTGDDAQLAFLSGVFKTALTRLDDGEWDVAEYVWPKPTLCQKQQPDGTWAEIACP
ncbi:MAG: hypothetical protein GEU75_11800 [Dehalococcoidia bacterium]|nr:hypothetical protein [Dehalococcoidia bacterium]